MLAMERSAGAELAFTLSALFKDPERVAALGRRYLAHYPEDADADRLAVALFGDTTRSQADAATMRADLARQRERDFRDGEVVVVDGWLLARSEARVCALSALLQQV